LHLQAVPFFKQAVALTTNNPTFYFNLGASLKFSGDFAGAKAAYQKTIALAPLYCKAHAALSSLGGISADNNHIATLTKLEQQLSQPDDLLYIGHALAREYETLGDFEQAFKQLQAAKQNKLAQLDYDISQDRAMFASLTATFTEAEQNFSAGHQSDEALFIVGMPRTGTTLVERILSQHSEVTTAGELQHFGLLLKKLSETKTNRVIDVDTIAAARDIDFAKLGQAYIESTRAITGKTAKFVDKMPLNVLYAGFILTALPKAKIVCLDRNPLDSIVSNFRQLFAVNFSYYNYAYDLTTTAQFYLMFKDLIATWLQRFPDNFYIVNYERLVNNPQDEACKLVEFCGLEWQEACLNIDQNTAPVATASAVQVRQPINNKSVGNWRKYDAYLEQVKQVLSGAGVDVG
jgi:tetratricopeptide (TPR) repeat protein